VPHSYRSRTRATTGSGICRIPSKFTRPADHSKRVFELLVKAPVFRDYQRAFEQATGLPLSFRSVESWNLAHHGNRNQNRFCALLSTSSRSCAACLQMQQNVCDKADGESHTTRCSFGLIESAVAVKAGQTVIGFLQTGQVFFKAPDQAQTDNMLQQIKAWGLHFDLEDTARAYQETSVVDRGAYQATVRLLQFFASHLVAVANQAILAQQNAEPAQITRARRFIEANYREKLTLGIVAREAGMSLFHFCKTFKKTTGLTFVHYLSRVRVESAKTLLLNQNYRVSEIAYEVGFQSLTHFNRVFKAIAGQSPTDFRQRAALGARAPHH